jgi:cysteinyl-tRNA synthetase
MNGKEGKGATELKIYNTLSREKENFTPLNPGHVGMYVCGPTVYGHAHLGHARPAVTFDMVFRYLRHLGHKVRYVRNITDVGHLENDADQGEDKIGKKARLEELEPMEIVQRYTDSYHENMRQLNVTPPSIEPRATGHIIEQIEMVKTILDKGYAYQSGGSVYFDVGKYNEKHNYGKLSGRKLEDMMANTRELDGQGEKKKPYDFALWKQASPAHIMRWPSPWGEGFPGWHLECSAMGAKYLGQTFDIHGGGMDLTFPHHECEIAQSVAANGKEHVRYWMHNNMITINGQKMGKSLGNFITLDELFKGTHKILQQAYAPMTVRFFILQAHYRSTLDFSNEALQAAEKGLKRLTDSQKQLEQIKASAQSSEKIKGLAAKLKAQCYAAMNDDFNTPVAIAHLFDGIRHINTVANGQEKMSQEELGHLKNLYKEFIVNVFGLKGTGQEENKAQEELAGKLIDNLLELRLQAKKEKNFDLSDSIRDRLNELGVEVRDKKNGWEWELK